MKIRLLAVAALLGCLLLLPGSARPNSFAITIDGPGVAVTELYGETSSVTFDGTAGQTLGFGINHISQRIKWKIVEPDGVTILQQITTGTHEATNYFLPALPVSGTYTIQVWGDTCCGFNGTGGGTLYLSKVPIPVGGGSITLDGPNQSVSITRIGQYARYSFAGAQGQYMTLPVTNVNGNLQVYVKSPSGTLLANSTSTQNRTYTLSNLPESGTYTVSVVPNTCCGFTGGGSATLALKSAACPTCPAYVAYEGSQSSQFGVVKHLSHFGVRRVMTTNYLDQGDVFKLNAAKTGYDYVDAGILLGPNGPGWCAAGGDITSEDQFYCGVVQALQLPAPIKTWRQRQQDAEPSCQAGADLIEPMQDPGGGIANGMFYSALVQCSLPMQKIVAVATLKSEDNVDFFLPRQKAGGWSNVGDDKVAVGDVFPCPPGQSVMTLGVSRWMLHVEFMAITLDGHVWPPRAPGERALYQQPLPAHDIYATPSAPVCQPDPTSP